MSRWFDCPDCIGYCEEWICECCGVSRCEMCNQKVTFEDAPEAIRQQMYKAGLWCEEIAVVVDEDGERHYTPAFNSREEYDRFVEWNAARMVAPYDQLMAMLCDDSDEGKPLFKVGEYTIRTATEDDENWFDKLTDEHVEAKENGRGSVSVEWEGQKYSIDDQGVAAIAAACERGEPTRLVFVKNDNWVSVWIIIGKKDVAAGVSNRME